MVFKLYLVGTYRFYLKHTMLYKRHLQTLESALYNRNKSIQGRSNEASPVAPGLIITVEADPVNGK